MNKQQYLALPIPAVTERNLEIIEAVKAAGFVLKDDHDNKGERTLALAGVVVYQRDGRQVVAALFDVNFSSYYCLNRIDKHADGSVSVTRDNCAGIVSTATQDPVKDVNNIIEGIAWDVVEKYPSLVPGQYFNFELKVA
jgi:hypothetical protein